MPAGIYQSCSAAWTINLPIMSQFRLNTCISWLWLPALPSTGLPLTRPTFMCDLAKSTFRECCHV
jgi:hypothetical protein